MLVLLATMSRHQVNFLHRIFPSWVRCFQMKMDDFENASAPNKFLVILKISWRSPRNCFHNKKTKKYLFSACWRLTWTFYQGRKLKRKRFLPPSFESKVSKNGSVSDLISPLPVLQLLGGPLEDPPDPITGFLSSMLPGVSLCPPSGGSPWPPEPGVPGVELSQLLLLFSPFTTASGSDFIAGGEPLPGSSFKGKPGLTWLGLTLFFSFFIFLVRSAQCELGSRLQNLTILPMLESHSGFSRLFTWKK